MKKVTVFIDESGTLPDPKDKVVIVAAVGTQSPEKLIAISKSVRKFQKRNGVEIKFYRAGGRTKTKFLEHLAKEDVGIFILIVDKQGKTIEDSPENFALLCWLVLEDCLMFYGKEVREIVFDRHFHQEKDQELFNNTLFKLLGRKINFIHVDSQKDKRISSADMVAGSVLSARIGKESRFYELIKKKFWHKKMSEPAQAPIQTIENSIRRKK